MTAATRMDPKLRALRDAFDGSFAEASGGVRPAHVDFLALRIAGDPYAVRLSEIQSLQVSKTLVPAPSQVPALLGLAGFRGVLTPIYDLGQLLGYSGEPSAKWLVVAQSASPIGFAFGAFDIHLRVTLDRISAAEDGVTASIRGAVLSDTGALPLLHLPSIVEGIAQRIKAFGSSQER
jgi:chemotaxis signal transduction protein